MAIALDFTLTEASDGLSLTFTETTGDATGGYDGTPVFSDVANTRFEWELPDTNLVKISVGYLPTQNTSPNGTHVFISTDIGLNTIGSGVYTLTYKVYTSACAQGAGCIAVGVEYIVTGSGYTILYNGNVYTTNDIFIGVAGVGDYTIQSGSGTINAIEASATKDFVLYRKAEKCIQGLLLTKCNKCDCGDDLYDAAMELLADFQGALVAGTVGNNKCANDTLRRIDTNCANICNDCTGGGCI